MDKLMTLCLLCSAFLVNSNANKVYANPKAEDISEPSTEPNKIADDLELEVQKVSRLL